MTTHENQLTTQEDCINRTGKFPWWLTSAAVELPMRVVRLRYYWGHLAARSNACRESPEHAARSDAEKSTT